MERKGMLNDQFHFHCQCRACECNYPLETDVREKNIPDLRVLKPTSRVSLDTCAAYLNKFAKWSPCKQLLFADQEYVIRLQNFYNEMSMGHRLSSSWIPNYHCTNTKILELIFFLEPIYVVDMYCWFSRMSSVGFVFICKNNVWRIIFNQTKK